MGRVAIYMNGPGATSIEEMLSAKADLIVDAVGNKRAMIVERRANSFLLRKMEHNVEFKSLDFNGERDDWNTAYAYCQRFIRENDITHVVLMKSQMGQWRHGGGKMFKDFYDQFSEQPRMGQSYSVTRKCNEKAMFCIAALDDEDVEVVHLVNDPGELRYDSVIPVAGHYDVRYCLDIPDYCTYIQSHEPALCRRIGRRAERLGDKELDFTLAFSCLTVDRRYMEREHPYLKAIPKSRVAYHGNVNGRRSPGVRQERYYNWLADARYTLIIPSYDPRTFSIERFMDAVFADCFPWVVVDEEHGCNLDALRATFPQICEIVEENMVCTWDEVRDFEWVLDIGERWRLETLHDIRSTDDYKMMVDEELAVNNWRNALHLPVTT